MTAVDFGRYKRIVQYFWDPEPMNDAASPIWCLGQEYKVSENLTASTTSSNHSSRDDKFVSVEPIHAARPATPPDSTASSLDSGLACDESGNVEDNGGWPSSFLDDFEARVWLTYRSNFPIIPKSQDPKASSLLSLTVRIRSQLVDQAGFTTDTGWGCMIRSGQSLLANALVMLRMGRGLLSSSRCGNSCINDFVEWRRGSHDIEERKILSLFADDPKAPYSIHKFVEHGATACGKHPGEWFGPSATARCIQ